MKHTSRHAGSWPLAHGRPLAAALVLTLVVGSIATVAEAAAPGSSSLIDGRWSDLARNVSCAVGIALAVGADIWPALLMCASAFLQEVQW